MIADLQQRFDLLEERRRLLLDRVGAMDAPLQRYHPAPASWSMLQVVEHLVLVEGFVLNALKREASPSVRRRWWHRIGAWMVAFVFRRGFRVPAPTQKVVPKSDAPLAQTAVQWQALREELRSLLEETTPESARVLRFRHPVAGPLDTASSLDFVRTHFDHHLRQIARIEKSFGRATITR